jgi:hypothetical protein
MSKPYGVHIRVHCCDFDYGDPDASINANGAELIARSEEDTDLYQCKSCGERYAVTMTVKRLGKPKEVNINE